jgi:TRAP-type transport system small permease protein
MRWILFCLANLAEIGATVFMVLMFLSTVTNVIARYVFNSPIQWAEEFSRYAFIWLVFLGSAACTKRKRHIAIEGLVAALPSRIRGAVVVVADLATVAFVSILLVYGWKLTMHATQTTATLVIPKSIVYAVIPFTACLLLGYGLADLRRHVGSLWRGGGPA